MPTAPLVKCGENGCRARVSHGRCREHAKQFEQRRGTAEERGYDWNWKKLRRWFIRQPENVLCAHCN